VRGQLEMNALLGALPNGSTVALVTLLGSLCPVTQAHVRCFEEARRLLMGEGGPHAAGRFAGFVGMFALNNDWHVQRKLTLAGETDKRSCLSFDDRRHLVELATAGLPWLGFSSAGNSTQSEARRLQESWPQVKCAGAGPKSGSQARLHHALLPAVSSNDLSFDFVRRSSSSHTSR
jgi:hypothetical protein